MKQSFDEHLKPHGAFLRHYRAPLRWHAKLYGCGSQL